MESPTSEKSRVVAGVLGLYLGWLRIHKFYLGIPTARYHLIVGGAGLAVSILSMMVSAMVSVMSSGGIFAGFFVAIAVLFSTVGYLALLVSGIAGHVEGVMYLAKSNEQFSEIYVEGKKPWF